MKKSIWIIFGLMFFSTIILIGYYLLDAYIGAKMMGVGDPNFLIDGNRISVRTYRFEEHHVILPFCVVLGGKFVDSPYNTYTSICKEGYGKRYVIDFEKQLFMLEPDLIALESRLKEEGKTLNKTIAAEYTLLPPPNEDESYCVEWGNHEVYVDHLTIEKVLKEIGIEITIECDFEKKTISIVRGGKSE